VKHTKKQKKKQLLFACCKGEHGKEVGDYEGQQAAMREREKNGGWQALHQLLQLLQCEEE